MSDDAIAAFNPLPVPSLGERVSRCIGHGGLVIAGIYGAVGTLPKSLLFAAEPVQLMVWSMFLCTGLIAAVATLRGAFLVEYAMLPFMTGGVLVYWAAIGWVVITGENLGSGVAWGLMTSLSAYLCARMFSLNQLVRGPARLLGEKVKRRFNRTQEGDE